MIKTYGHIHNPDTEIGRHQHYSVKITYKILFILITVTKGLHAINAALHNGKVQKADIC